jgi:hypothetical protein
MTEGGGDEKASRSTPPVFSSYASQDADAAKRICDALRTAGLDVWFDQNELRGGDACDASIRRQVKECALFMSTCARRLARSDRSLGPSGFVVDSIVPSDASACVAEQHDRLGMPALKRVCSAFKKGVRWITRENQIGEGVV